ncbi:MAG: efflux RND transporter periplasmic adaptor subunit [Allorhizobium sp.]
MCQLKVSQTIAGDHILTGSYLKNQKRHDWEKYTHGLHLSTIPFRIIGLGLVGTLLAACDDGSKSAEPSPQSVHVVKAAMLEQKYGADITGEVRARIQTDLAFRLAGKVVERRVDVGSHVRAGDVLARIDDTEQRADVESAEAGLLAAQATLNQKTLAFKRYEGLVESRAIAQATYDQAKEELATAQGSLESAQASLAIAKDALSHTELKAEAEGIITARSIEVGQVVSAAQPALTLAHDGARDAVFDVFEAFFLAGQPDATATVAPVSSLDTRITATLREIAPVIDTTSGTIRVKMALPEDTRWSLGTPIVGNFRTPSVTAITLPWSAMTSAEGKPAVWIVDAAARSVALRPITVARYRTGEFIVSAGVSAEDLVVADGGKFLRPGQPVTWEAD